MVLNSLCLTVPSRFSCHTCVSTENALVSKQHTFILEYKYY